MATNFIDYGNKAVENGIIDGGKHEILYFHAGSNNDWFNSANWYYDNAYTVPANKYPDSDDIVYIVDENVSSSKNTTIQIDYLSVTRTGYGVNWNNGPQHLEWGNGLNIECSYSAVFNNLNDYGCGYLKNYANITAPAITFNLSSNYGTLNGATVFAYNYGPCENFGNFGTVNGTVSFNSGGDTYWSSAKNQGIINGNATFYNSAANTSIINGNANFYNYSATFSGSKINGNSNFNDDSWADSSTLSGDVNLYSSSYAYGCSIFGNVFLYNSSYISSSTIYGNIDSSSNNYYNSGNTVNGNLSLTSAQFNSATINGNVVLNGSSYLDNSTVNGNATSYAYSYMYWCTINGLVELYNSSYCTYCTINNASLFGLSYINDSYVSNDLVANNNASFAYNTIIDSITLNNNARSVSSNSAASATFNDSSSNDNCNLTCPSAIFNDYSSNASSSIVTGNATFNDSSDNNGTVTGNATFNDASDNNGTVSGTVTCNTTGVCGAPPSGSSTNSDLALLMHFDGPTFEDSSLHRLAITTNGSPAISNAQSKFGGASGYFDGNGDYLEFPGIGFDASSGDWTIEAWIRPESITSSFPIVTGSNRDFYYTYVYENGSLLLIVGDGVVNQIIDARTDTPPAQTWWHVALVRSGGSMYAYENGVLVSQTSEACKSSLLTSMEIGSDVGASVFSHGYIDELRIVKGVALYTSNFTPPTTPYQDPEPPNPSLLMHFDGSSFVDSSLNNLSITNTGVSLSSTESKFGGSSGYFDGSSQLTIPLSSSLEFNTGDFTIETWVYLTSLSSDTFVTSPINNGGWFFGFDGNLHLGFGRKFVAWDLNAPDTIPTNTWIHIAATRQQGTLRLFINGMKSAEMSNNLIDYSLSGADMVIGSHYNSMWLSGYIDELRIIKGKALYISNFVPSTAPTPNPIVPSLLLNFEGPDGSTNFVDSGPNNVPSTAVADAAISTNGGWHSSSSLHLPVATSDMLNFDVLNTNGAFYFAADFTLECWLYRGSCSGDISLFVSWEDGQPGPFAINLDCTNFNIYPQQGANVSLGPHGIIDNKWTHIAAVRYNNLLTLYINGMSVATLPWSGAAGYLNPTVARIGGGGSPQNWYIDQFRIIKDTALYTSNFNPF